MYQERESIYIQLDQINRRLESIENWIKKLTPPKSKLERDDLLDNQDLMELFKCSLRTLQNYRDKKILPYIKFDDGKCYYRPCDVKEVLKQRLNR